MIDNAPSGRRVVLMPLAARLRYACLMTSVVVCLAAATRAEEPRSDPRALLQQLQEATIDPSQVNFVHNVRLSRGGATLYFNRGFAACYAPVGGEFTGGVFAGDGEVLLIPSSPVEKASLARFTHSAILEERFTSAYMRFTDGSCRELMENARKPQPDDPEQPGNFAGLWNPLVRRLNPAYSIRLMEDLLGDRSFPFFQARLEGVTLGLFQVVDDERLPEAMRVGAVVQHNGRTFSDIWCSMPSPRSEQRRMLVERGNVRVLAYTIQTRLNDDHSLGATAELELESLSSSDRVLVFDLSRRLEVLDVRNDRGVQLPVIQNPVTEEVAGVLRESDTLAVVLPAPEPEGTRFRLTFKYRGSVIKDVGNGVLFVEAHSNWYPNLGTSMPATYDLRFDYPAELTLVATGQQVAESVSGGRKHSRWVSDGAARVAGFNLGRYTVQRRKAGGVSIEVYATKEVEAALAKRLGSQQPPIQILTGVAAEGRRPVRIIAAPPPPILHPTALLDQIAEQTADAVRYFETLFGPFPYPRIGISQIPGNFGQGWPELVYLPTFTFLPDTPRPHAAPPDPKEQLQNQLFVSHEVAHQWWGNLVGWENYHDQWLSEGFATYAAALALAQDKDGERKFRDLLHVYKQDLLAKTPGGITIESGGPIWLGQRLTNSQNPSGYDDIVYKKSCWVLHMLRVMMTDPKTGSDERFFRMLRDFAAAYRGKSPSTEDFLSVADRYMTPAMDLEHNHRLNWFFTDWVYGTGIPTYRLHATTRRVGPNRFVTQGTIEQSGVPPEFEMLVPVVATNGREKRTSLGQVAVDADGGKFRFSTSFKPARVTINVEDLLAEVKD